MTYQPENIVAQKPWKCKDLYSPEILNESFEYFPETGQLIWRRRPRTHFLEDRTWKLWNTKWAGKSAGCVKSRGYVRLSLRYCGEHREFAVSRIIWTMLFGPIPVGITVDHKDNNPSNNRLDNLRLATDSQQLRNRRTFQQYRRGVRFNRHGKFVAYMTRDGKYIHLGCFSSEEEAANAHIAAASKFADEFTQY